MKISLNLVLRSLAILSLVTGCGSDGDAGSSTGTTETVGGTSASAGSGANGTSANKGGAAGTASSRATSAGGVPNTSSYREPVETIDLNAAPVPITTLNLEVDASTIPLLDADPYHSNDVPGALVDGNAVRYDPIDVNYRGAYALRTLIISNATQRNWKLKFSKAQPYQGRREWNFNYEPHVRQRLAYWLMHLANVKVPSARHVVLRVNAQVHGLHLEFEDPDNKTWLADKFGDNSGDLFKAAYDVPDETAYFATLEILGSTDSDYAMHYRKMTNNDDPTKATDFSSLRNFITKLNQTPDGEFEAFLRQNFDVERFISYLVVANFISHWDSFPQRPKNYWLYQVPATGKWTFIPWDMDATFQSGKFTLNPMGTDVSVFYQFDGFVEYRGRNAAEGTARPLITRTMKVPAFRTAYVARYREAIATFLAKDYLLGQVTRLFEMNRAVAQPDELQGLTDARSDMEEFINKRSASVSTELAKQP
ncbi:MAG TPA: CotH kinase family protein [Polyangiaceae bacterium]